jgi:hypothetical protein
VRVHIALVTLFVLYLAVGAAFPQAAAESVLLNGNSATAAAKAGAAMGNALNKASNKIAGQIQTVQPAKVVTHKVQSAPQAQSHPSAPATSTTTTTTTTTSNGAPMITSIQGGRVTRSSATPTPPAHN